MNFHNEQHDYIKINKTIEKINLFKTDDFTQMTKDLFKFNIIMINFNLINLDIFN